MRNAEPAYSVPVQGISANIVKKPEHTSIDSDKDKKKSGWQRPPVLDIDNATLQTPRRNGDLDSNNAKLFLPLPSRGGTCANRRGSMPAVLASNNDSESAIRARRMSLASSLSIASPLYLKSPVHPHARAALADENHHFAPERVAGGQRYSHRSSTGRYLIQGEAIGDSTVLEIQRRTTLAAAAGDPRSVALCAAMQNYKLRQGMNRHGHVQKKPNNKIPPFNISSNPEMTSPLPKPKFGNFIARLLSRAQPTPETSVPADDDITTPIASSDGYNSKSANPFSSDPSQPSPSKVLRPENISHEPKSNLVLPAVFGRSASSIINLVSPKRVLLRTHGKRHKNQDSHNTATDLGLAITSESTETLSGEGEYCQGSIRSSSSNNDSREINKQQASSSLRKQRQELAAAGPVYFVLGDNVLLPAKDPGSWTSSKIRETQEALDDLMAAQRRRHQNNASQNKKSQCSESHLASSSSFSSSSASSASSASSTSSWSSHSEGEMFSKGELWVISEKLGLILAENHPYLNTYRGVYIYRVNHFDDFYECGPVVGFGSQGIVRLCMPVHISAYLSQVVGSTEMWALKGNEPAVTELVDLLEGCIFSRRLLIKRAHTVEVSRIHSPATPSATPRPTKFPVGRLKKYPRSHCQLSDKLSSDQEDDDPPPSPSSRSYVVNKQRTSSAIDIWRRGFIFAVKVMQKDMWSDSSIIYSMANFLGSLKGNPHTLRYYGLYEDPLNYFFLMERASGPGLLQYLGSLKKPTENDCATVFQQVLETLEFLHSQGIIHRDVKLQNFILRESDDYVPCIVLFDFGLACWDEDIQWIRQNGTQAYMAPESFRTRLAPFNDCSSKIDLWAAGVLLSFLLTGALPFGGTGAVRDVSQLDGAPAKVSWWRHLKINYSKINKREQSHEIDRYNYLSSGDHARFEALEDKLYGGNEDDLQSGESGQNSDRLAPGLEGSETSENRDVWLGFKFRLSGPLWAEVSPEARDLVKHLLTLNPEKRYSATQALHHPWFKKIASEDKVLPPAVSCGWKKMAKQQDATMQAGITGCSACSVHEWNLPLLNKSKRAGVEDASPAINLMGPKQSSVFRKAACQSSQPPPE